jgi:diguanylate cyclase (GGDEF)-like protein
MMPELDGVEVCRRLRALENKPFTFVLLLTAKGETSDVVTALDAGADDYLRKPYEADELRSRIGAGERIVRLNIQLEEANAKFAGLASTDSLTQIMNRRAVMDRLESELARAVRQQSDVAVYMLDVDHFKSINDNHGHVAGDTVLVEVARRLAGQCRRYDAIGRYGGEEFLAIFPGPKGAEVEKIGERLRAAITGLPIAAGGHGLGVTISVGALWVAPPLTDKVDQIVKAADDLLYEAKAGGRNCVRSGRYMATARMR